MRRFAFGLVLLAAWAFAQPALAGPSRLDEREAATTLFKRTLFTLGASAYCHKNVDANQNILDATAEWNQRHKPFAERIVAVLRATGDLSKEEKDEIDKGGYKQVRAAMNSRAACDEHLKALEQGRLELATAPDTRERYAIVQRASLITGDKVWIVLTMTDGNGRPLQMTFHNPPNPIPSMAECRNSLPSIEPSLVKSAREREAMFRSAKFARVECILSSEDPLRPN